MKILVCNPPGRFPGNRYICPFPSRWTSMFQDYPVFIYYPYELAYLSTLLKRELPGHQVKMIDGSWMRFTAEDYIRFIEHEKPDWVVFEVDTVTYGQTLRIANQVGKTVGTEIIFTGQYPTAFPEKVVADGYQWVCIGEFEETVLEILKGRDPASISGLHPNGYRKVLDLDWLPNPEDEDIRRIDYSYSGGHRWTRYREIEVHPSRGCPYTCDFCVAGTVYYENINWRFRKPRHIVREIETLRRKYPQMEGCFFNEETHIIRKKDILEFCDALIDSSNNDLHYEAMANHQRLDEEILVKLKKAGYYKLRVGIESVDEATGQSIGLVKTQPDRLEKVLKIARKLGIEMYGTFLFGASGSTLEGDAETVAFGKRMISQGLLSSWQASIAVPHPATPFYDKAVKKGWLLTDNFDRFNGINDTVVSYPHYSRDQILDTVRGMRESFEKAQPFETVTRPKSVAQKKTRLLKQDLKTVNTRLDALTPIFENGEDARVLQEARKILEEYPQALTANHVMGSVYKRMSDWVRAREQFQRVVETAVDYEDALKYAASAHYHLGTLALVEENEKEALQQFKNCLHLNPHHQASRKHFWKLQTETEPRDFSCVENADIISCDKSWEASFFRVSFNLLKCAQPVFKSWFKSEQLKIPGNRLNGPLTCQAIREVESSEVPHVSAIIRAYNEEKFIGRTLEQVFSQKDISLEVIVIDSESTDSTLDIVKSFPARIVRIKKTSFGYGSALNLGARLARGEIIVNLSAHAIPENDSWLKRLIEPLSDSGIAGVHGAEKPLEGWCSAFESKILRDSFSTEYCERTDDSFFSNANAAFMKKLLIEFPFDESVGWAEDRLWAHAMQQRGYRTAYQPHAVVYHSHNLTFKQHFERSFKFYRMQFETLQKNNAETVRENLGSSFVTRAKCLRQFLIDEDWMNPITAFFYSGFSEFVNYFACDIAWKQSLLQDHNVRKISDLQNPEPQLVNQEVSL